MHPASRLFAAFANAATAAAAAVIFSAPAWAADPVNIGLVPSICGLFSAYGKPIEHGVKLYLTAKGDTFGGREVS